MNAEFRVGLISTESRPDSEVWIDRTSAISVSSTTFAAYKDAIYNYYPLRLFAMQTCTHLSTYVICFLLRKLPWTLEACMVMCSFLCIYIYVTILGNAFWEIYVLVIVILCVITSNYLLVHMHHNDNKIRS